MQQGFTQYQEPHTVEELQEVIEQILVLTDRIAAMEARVYGIDTQLDWLRRHTAERDNLDALDVVNSTIANGAKE